MVNEEKCQDKSDEEIVRLTIENQDYLAVLIKRYEDKLLRYINRISNNSREEAEDMVQEIFIKVYTNLNDFDPELKFSSWVYRIAHNHAISNFRKNKARGINEQIEIDEKLANSLAGDINTVKEIDHILLKKSVNKILGRMESKYREVLVLKYLEEKEYKEISDILKKPMGTIATLINRAKKQFKIELDKQRINI